MKRIGQSTLEYAVVIAMAVGAFLAMQHYMRRGVEGKLRESSDQIGEQYSAGHVTSTYTTEQTGELKTKETFGLKEGVGDTKGTSRYEVIQAAATGRKAIGADAEKVTKKLSEEELMPKH